MPPVACCPPALRGRAFLARDVVAAGLLTRRQLDGPAWRRLHPGVYVDAREHLTHGRRIDAARLVLPPSAVVAGRSAAWLYGARTVVDEQDPVEILVPTADRFGPVQGLRIHTCAVLPPEARTAAGRTTRARTAADVARWAGSLTTAVVQLDQLLAARVLRAADYEEALGWLPRRGTARARRALELADGRAESPPESVVRVALVLAGLAPVPQFEVRHAGQFCARVDLALVQARIAVEYDGSYHEETGRFRRDRERLNRLTAAGWRVLHVTAADLRDLDGLIAQVLALVRVRGNPPDVVR